MSDFSQLVEEYATIASYVDEEERRLKEIKEVRDKVKDAMLACMNELGIDSAKSAAGHTITKVTNYTVKVVDPAEFKQFILASEDTDLIQNRASTDACRAFTEQNGYPPPGTEVGSMITLRFNRSK